MRMIVINELQDLTQRLLGPGKPRAEIALDRLKQLNPHVDFTRLDSGTVLLVPDHPDFKDGDATSIGGEAFDSLAKDATAGLKAAGARIRAGFERQQTEHKELTAVFRSATFKRLAESDEALKAQVMTVELRLKAQSKRALEIEATLATMEKGLRGELDALAKLLA